jgi:iron complex outermembrane receptor protein
VLIWNSLRLSEAVFGQALYKLTDCFELQARLTYSHYHLGSDVNLIIPEPFTPFLPPFKNSEQDSHVTGKVALNWQANPDNYFYIFAATGHTTGGVNVIASLPRTFGPQETYDYEAGWKAKFFEGALHTQLGVFYDDIRHYQVTFTAHAGSGAFAPFFRNLQSPTTVYGVELTAQGAIGDFSYDFGAAFLHSSAGTGTIFDQNGADQTTTGGTDVPLAGRPLPYTPKATVNVGAQYKFRLPSDATLTPRVDVAWTDVQIENLLDGISIDPVTHQRFHFQRVPAHTNINAEITYERKGLEVSVYGSNLTNQHYVEAASGGGDNGYLNEPLQFGVRVKKTF